MPYKSGKIITGTQHGMVSEVPTSGDREGAKPKATKTATTFKARNLPLNVAGPRGQSIEFTGGYYVTEDKDIIAFLKKEFGNLCDIC